MMSEIKSTLDLVMERTRQMTLSAEEKAHQKKADCEKRLQSLLLQADALLELRTGGRRPVALPEVCKEMPVRQGRGVRIKIDQAFQLPDVGQAPVVKTVRPVTQGMDGFQNQVMHLSPIGNRAGFA